MNTKITELEQQIKALKEQIAAINQNTFEIGKLAGKFTAKAQELEIKLAEVKKEAEKELEFKKVDIGENFYYITFCDTAGITTLCDIESPPIGNPVFDPHYNACKIRFLNNNYFHTETRAQEVADKIKFLLKLERLHDTYCPDFVPDLSNNEKMWRIIYDVVQGKYIATWITSSVKRNTDTYFSSNEIAQKICDMLNKEEVE